MKLYGDLISPFVRACMVVAEEIGVAGAIELVPTAVRISKANADLAKLSPIAQIPVLVDNAGQSLHDSRVIVEYLVSLVAEQTLVPREGARRFRILTLQATALGAAEAAVAYRNETAQRPAELHWPTGLDRLRQRVEDALDRVEQSWLSELGEITTASISVAVLLSYLDYRFAAWDWRKGRPELTRFHADFAQRPSMLATSLPPL